MEREQAEQSPPPAMPSWPLTLQAQWRRFYCRHGTFGRNDFACQFMSAHAYTEDPLVVQPTIGLFTDMGWWRACAPLLSDQINIDAQ